MKLTKIKIEELVTKIEEFLKEHELLDSVCIYFNNKRRVWDWDWHNDGAYKVREEDDIDPHDYFEYAAHNHILSMSFEGPLNAILNGNTENWKLEEQFEEILKKYNLYYELGNSWNLTCYPIKDMEVEYTMYEEPAEPTYLYLSNPSVIPPELKNIMTAWYELSKTVGDRGSCVIGAGFKFTWKEKEYFMGACSPWQGSLSWEAHIKTVEEKLQTVGATNILYDYGRID